MGQSALPYGITYTPSCSKPPERRVDVQIIPTGRGDTYRLVVTIDPITFEGRRPIRGKFWARSMAEHVLIELDDFVRSPSTARLRTIELLSSSGPAIRFS